MNKTTASERALLTGDGELLDEYDIDYSKAKPNPFVGQVRGRRVLVPLDPDVSQVFQTAESVNRALRHLIEAMPEPRPTGAGTVREAVSSEYGETAMPSAGGSVMRLDRLALLEFFDEAPSESQGHATAVCSVVGEDLGLGLLKHYFERRGSPQVCITRPCTPRTRSGHRLDGWLRVTEGERVRLFQVEVKNWSAHAIGGKRLPVNAPGDEVVNYRKACFARYYDAASRKVLNPHLAKVLEPMAADEDLSPDPLACMWYAMHPEGCDEPLFSVPVDSAHFREVWFFSMSNYLRQLTEPFISIEMKDSRARLGWLDRLTCRGEP